MFTKEKHGAENKNLSLHRRDHVLIPHFMKNLESLFSYNSSDASFFD